MSENLPMSDVVQMVLRAENESKRILEKAEAVAERIVAEARQEAQSIVERTRHEAMQQADALVSGAERDAEAEKQTRLAQAADEIHAMVRLDEKTAQSAVQAILRCVCADQ